MAAITGFQTPSGMALPMVCFLLQSSPAASTWARSLRSMPEQNERPAPVSTAIQMSSLFLTSSQASASAWLSA